MATETTTQIVIGTDEVRLEYCRVIKQLLRDLQMVNPDSESVMKVLRFIDREIGSRECAPHVEFTPAELRMIGDTVLLVINQLRALDGGKHTDIVMSIEKELNLICLQSVSPRRAQRRKKDMALNMGELAEELGFSPGYVSAMRKAGFVPDRGSRSTLECAQKWLAEHPQFRIRSVYTKKD